MIEPLGLGLGLPPRQEPQATGAVAPRAAVAGGRRRPMVYNIQIDIHDSVSNRHETERTDTNVDCASFIAERIHRHGTHAPTRTGKGNKPSQTSQSSTHRFGCAFHCRILSS